MITTASTLARITTVSVLHGATMTIITLMMMVGLKFPIAVSVDMTVRF